VVAAAGRGGGGFGGGGGANSVFTLKQNGGSLTGTVEGGGGGRGFGGGGGSDTPAAIEEGKVDGANVSFKVGAMTYTGTVKGDQIELQITGGAGFGGRGARPAPTPPTGPQPVIGPPPDGTDPSSGAFAGGGGRGGQPQTPPPTILRRATH